MLILFAAATVLTAPQSGGGPVPYEQAVRCAGLTQAASELEGGESREGQSLYDAALYWSLSAMNTAQAAGRADALAEADQTHARILAVRQLSQDDAPARAELDRCRRLTPRLD